MTPKLLVVDVDHEIPRLLKTLYQNESMDILMAGSCDAALGSISSDRPNVAVIDMSISGRSWLELLVNAKKIDPGLAVIMTSGISSTQHAIEAMKAGAYDYLPKPFNLNQLKAVIQKALECNLFSKKVLYSKMTQPGSNDDESAGLMIGSSPEMIEIWKMVGKVAATDATALIQGESGTGKELLARAIYTNSLRMNRPFMAVNCAALPENLLESELFGHEKGAFTDAHARRIGKFEQCNGGTLFLDEIGDMSLAHQGKLLRVLENQEFERVGGNETIKVNVRIIAATNRSLVNLVKEKSFRMDLFYRLRVVSFFLPPLRDRVEDIPLLVEYFVNNFARKYGKNNTHLTQEAVDLLVAQSWEGNIRELKNVIDSATVMSKGEQIMPSDLEPFIQIGAGTAKLPGSSSSDDYYGLFKDMLEPQFERTCLKSRGKVYEELNTALTKALIRIAMEKSSHNQVVVAKVLGISRNTLRDRLEKYNFGNSHVHI
jgi:DNA-binding NtrC family response regulator